MSLYQYFPLETPEDIRLVTVLPGKPDDAIEIEIERTALVAPPEKISHSRVSLGEIRKSLPPDWWAFETTGGRMLYRNDVINVSSWSHPDSEYDCPVLDPIPSRRADPAPPEYEALSYTWGPPVGRGDEIVDGLPAKVTRLVVKGSSLSSRTSDPEYLDVGLNLFEALKHLRYADQPRTIWVDALCINQDDVTERIQQVVRMRDIYTLASRVVAWLGPDFPGCRLALSILDYLGGQVEVTRDNHIITSPDAGINSTGDSIPIFPPAEDGWNAILYLLSHTWFGRLWVLQEIQLASDASILQCGDNEASWARFCGAVRHLSRQLNIVPANVLGKVYAVTQICCPTRDMIFEDILHSHHTRRCQDARDKIYGMASLAPPAVARSLRVDYSQTPGEVYRQAFLAHAQRTRRLDLFKFCGQRVGTPAPCSPSWVPDWSRDAEPGYLFAKFAAGNSAARFAYSDPGTLEVSGRLCATIREVQGLHFVSFADFARYLCSLDLDGMQTSLYPTGETLLDAYLHTFTMGKTDEREPWVEYPPLATFREEMLRLREATDQGLEHRLTAYYEREIISGLKLRGRCGFATDEGYIGVCSVDLQPGDQVFVVLGCEVPVIARPDTAGRYQMIGECFVHGLMDGEALLGRLELPYVMRAFVDPDGFPMNRALCCTLDSKVIVAEDPRLQDVPLPAGWEAVEFRRTREDPRNCTRYQNTVTGEVINSDPRLTPEALIERGVDIRTITLV
ncbi:uncharacterized protein JN550_005713 [Neoarthrinium moseri]|uniref:uncharacterized protein n=1 Tax=Neoarthrinium moseri TaxID=1658444 RepID=UPI001FDD5D3E|nr:uncharacterized protein JN550_005713 [Neoarthrinium moseri]KAI1869732.1 hypothetical protein JN550_005713 [Neoarthrinium moseri]